MGPRSKPNRLSCHEDLGLQGDYKEERFKSLSHTFRSLALVRLEVCGQASHCQSLVSKYWLQLDLGHGEVSRRGALTPVYIARVFKLATRTGSVLETTLSPSTWLEIDATDVAVTAVEVGRPCMQEVQGGPQAQPYISEIRSPSTYC